MLTLLSLGAMRLRRRRRVAGRKAGQEQDGTFAVKHARLGGVWPCVMVRRAARRVNRAVVFLVRESRLGSVPRTVARAVGPRPPERAAGDRAAACRSSYLCYGPNIVMNAMYIAFRRPSTCYEIAGVFARILRIPGTLACPGCNR